MDDSDASNDRPDQRAWDSWRSTAVLARHLSARMRKNTSWYVEILSSKHQDWELSRLLGTESSRSDAIERLIACARAIATGTVEPGAPTVLMDE
jgi:hypothetical protein